VNEMWVKKYPHFPAEEIPLAVARKLLLAGDFSFALNHEFDTVRKTLSQLLNNVSPCAPQVFLKITSQRDSTCSYIARALSTSTSKPQLLHSENGRSVVLRNVGILPQQFTASQPRRPRPEVTNLLTK
jgi:hypothetical protein